MGSTPHLRGPKGAIMSNRKRNIQLHFMVTQEERNIIDEKMEQLGTNNVGAYLRKMAIDGFIVNLDLSPVRELVSLLRRSSNNINQIAKLANETRNVAIQEIEGIREHQSEIWDKLDKLLSLFVKIQ